MMTYVRTLYSIFFLAFVCTLQSEQLNAMKRSTIIVTNKICDVCSCYYHDINADNFAGFDTPCQHGLCSNCFFASSVNNSSQIRKNLFSIYRTLVDFECQQCKQWFIVGHKKLFQEGSTNDLLEILCSGLGHAAKLVKAIDQISQNCSSKEAAELLNNALNSRGRSLFDIKGYDDDTILHEACRGNYKKVVKIILLAADNQAEDLVCVKNSFGQTALYWAIYNAKHYNGSIGLVKKLLNTISRNEACWNLINEQSMRYFACGDYSILMYAQSGTKENDQNGQGLIAFLQSYKPKDQ